MPDTDTTCLFIGGKYDAEHMFVTDGSPSLFFPDIVDGEVNREEYLRHTFSCNGGLLSVFAHSSLTKDDVIDYLICYYGGMPKEPSKGLFAYCVDPELSAGT